MLGINKKELVEDIRKIVEEVVEEKIQQHFVREYTVRLGGRGPGEPEERIENIKMMSTDYFPGYGPKIEGALRGMQSDVDKAKNNSIKALNGVGKLAQQLSFVGKTLMDYKDHFMLVTGVASTIKQIADEKGIEILALEERNSIEDREAENEG